jgi:hypothetical protein
MGYQDTIEIIKSVKIIFHPIVIRKSLMKAFFVIKPSLINKFIRENDLIL